MNGVTEKMRDKWKDKIKTICEASEVNQIELNEWEAEFINNIYDHAIYQEKDLSFNQSRALNNIYDKIGYNANVIISSGLTLLCLTFVPFLKIGEKNEKN